MSLKTMLTYQVKLFYSMVWRSTTSLAPMTLLQDFEYILVLGETEGPSIPISQTQYVSKFFT